MCSMPVFSSRIQDWYVGVPYAVVSPLLPRSRRTHASPGVSHAEGGTYRMRRETLRPELPRRTAVSWACAALTVLHLGFGSCRRAHDPVIV